MFTNKLDGYFVQIDREFKLSNQSQQHQPPVAPTMQDRSIFLLHHQRVQHHPLKNRRGTIVNSSLTVVKRIRVTILILIRESIRESNQSI